MLVVTTKSEKKSFLPFNETSAQSKSLRSFAELLKGVGGAKETQSTLQQGLSVILDKKQAPVVEKLPAKHQEGFRALLKNEKTTKVTNSQENAFTKKQEALTTLLKNEKTTKQEQVKEDAAGKKQEGFVALLKNEKILKQEQSAENVFSKKKQEGFAALLKNDGITKGVNVESQERDLSQLKTSIQTTPISIQELKTLIVDAKEYLKTQILESEGYKKSEVKILPKTFKGLSAMAQKFGIDVTKITLEEGRYVEPKNLQSLSAMPVQNEVAKSDVMSAPRQNVVREVKSALPFIAAISESSKQTKKTEASPLAQILRTPESLSVKPLSTVDASIEEKMDVTQHPVQTKQVKSDEKFSERNIQEGLRRLLGNEKDTTSANGPTSTLFAQVTQISTQAQTQPTRTLESMLRTETSWVSQNNIDGTLKLETVPKAESLEVKIHEAKQMVRYLSDDIKTTIDAYKSPFTRVKLQLNPQRLGEVDVTVVQRGNNLHVNLSSNNAAINTLAIHANELRLQLQNSGINNATLHFNNQSENSGNGADSNGQHHRRQQQGHETYQALTQEDVHEEILSSLEIIIPRYI